MSIKWNERKREIFSELKHKIYTSFEINSKSQKTLSQIVGSLCNYFATKETVHILIQTEKVEIPQHAALPPCVQKFAELVQRPNEADDIGKCISFIKDLVHNAGKATGSRWTETSKSLFALILDWRSEFGGSSANVNRRTRSKYYLSNGVLRLYDSESTAVIFLRQG